MDTMELINILSILFYISGGVLVFLEYLRKHGKLHQSLHYIVCL